MQIVIDIPEDEYQRTMRHYEQFPRDLSRYERRIIDGTPLPKRHGRLIDADALVKKMEEREEKLKDDRSMWETATVETALDMYAQTIIEADGGDVE